jgi:hypothetical protein
LLHFGTEEHKCTDEERWASEPKWEAIKANHAKPTKLFNSKEEAEDWVLSGDHIRTKGTTLEDWNIQQKPKIYRRCEDNWCGVAEYCTQHLDSLK